MSKRTLVLMTTLTNDWIRQWKNDAMSENSLISCSIFIMSSLTEATRTGMFCKRCLKSSEAKFVPIDINLQKVRVCPSDSRPCCSATRNSSRSLISDMFTIFQPSWVRIISAVRSKCSFRSFLIFIDSEESINSFSMYFLTLFIGKFYLKYSVFISNSIEILIFGFISTFMLIIYTTYCCCVAGGKW